jgi:hypothetical protein
MCGLAHPTNPLFTPHSSSSAPFEAENTTNIYFVNEECSLQSIPKGEILKSATNNMTLFFGDKKSIIYINH